jgi:hypothetical protein
MRCYSSLITCAAFLPTLFSERRHDLDTVQVSIMLEAQTGHMSIPIARDRRCSPSRDGVN